jgi:hypothetical protein
MLPEPTAMLSADVDGLHGSFLAIDENSQRIFALTASGLTVVQLAPVPLTIGTITPNGAAAGGATLTIRGSGFQIGASASIGGKTATVTFVDMNTIKVTTPSLPAGAQRVVVSNPDGESTSWGRGLHRQLKSLTVSAKFLYLFSGIAHPKQSKTKPQPFRRMRACYGN